MPECGVRLIKLTEAGDGIENHLDAYYDPLSGNLPITIGYGSTRDENGRPFKMGDRITLERAESLLIHSLKTRYLPAMERIPYWFEMNEMQRGALLSFAYNLGPDFYGNSNFQTITKNLREKDWKSIPNTLLLYRNKDTPAEAGLLRRRKREALLWGLQTLDKMDWSW